jgi:hypothetical protein
MSTKTISSPSASAFQFGTKAQTLEQLSGRLTLANLCTQRVITTNEWAANRENIIHQIKEQFEQGTIVVRSSMDNEDGLGESQAGVYESIINVPPTPAEIGAAVDKVIASYGTNANQQEVLIQEMIQDVAVSGVILSRDLDTGAPYYVINYDDFSGKTDTVTGGKVSKIVQVQRARPDALESSRMRKLIEIMGELEEVTADNELDVEFCARSDMTVFVLQVRQLAAKHSWNAPSDIDVQQTLNDVRERVKILSEAIPDVVGSKTILGVMPDWNPAEMIGRTPRRLALSLYERLITDSVWAQARAYMGYRNVTVPLMKALAERPYIDVRLSLNSFIPNTLEDDLATKIVDWQLDQLSKSPNLHDKIEFEIAMTCLSPSFADYGLKMRAAGFSQTEVNAFRESLQKVTATALEGGAAAINDIAAKPEGLLTPAITDAELEPLRLADTLLDRTALKGTLPFSILARHAFIAVSFLKGLVARGILNEDESRRFLLSIHTVAADLREDMDALREGHVDRDAFLQVHGHLRPGTYDIQAWRYDERPDEYLDSAKKISPPLEKHIFELSTEQEEVVEKCLAEMNIKISAAALFDYMSAAIAARERSKFAFTRGLSDALKALCDWGDRVGLSREDMANMRISDILNCSHNIDDLKRLANEGRQGHGLARCCLLHHLICSPTDTDIVYPAHGEPTYIGNINVVAPGVTVVGSHHAALDDAIVLIESADPGYDWIFTYPIAGLITQYGGANSHMAIRCAEFGLPAAIGCGERTFEMLKSATMIELDCRTRRLATH